MVNSLLRIKSIRAKIDSASRALQLIKKMGDIEKKAMPHLESSDNTFIDMKIENLQEKERKLYISNYMKNKFSIDGVYFNNLEESSKERLTYYFNNL